MKFTATSWCSSSWTENFRKAKGAADANNIALNHWAAISVQVIERGRNLTSHDPDRIKRREI